MLVLEGGGMRAGFVAGALMALMDNGWTDFDVAVAVSASVPTLSYFAAGQREDMEHVWRHELCNSRLVCYRNIPATCLALSTQRPFLNIDYLVDEVFKKQHPLDMAALTGNRMKCRFAATRVPEGVFVLLDPGEYGEIYTLMKACLAVPGCYPGSVCVGSSHYLDGGAVHPLPFLGALRDGDQLMAILSKPKGADAHLMGFWHKLIFRRYLRHYDWMEEKLLLAEKFYREHVSFIDQQVREHPSRAVAIYPDQGPPAGFVTRNERKVNETIDLGYRKVEEMALDIKRFFQSNGNAENPAPESGGSPARSAAVGE